MKKFKVVILYESSKNIFIEIYENSSVDDLDLGADGSLQQLYSGKFLLQVIFNMPIYYIKYLYRLLFNFIMFFKTIYYLI